MRQKKIKLISQRQVSRFLQIESDQIAKMTRSASIYKKVNLKAINPTGLEEFTIAMKIKSQKKRGVLSPKQKDLLPRRHYAERSDN